MSTFAFQSLGVTGELFAAEKAKQVTARTKSGQITILARHTPMVSVLDIGQMIVKTTKKEHRFVITGGIIEVREEGDVIALVDEPKRAAAIDVAAAREAKQQARKSLQSIDDKSNQQFVKAEAKLRRNAAKIRAGSWKQANKS
jgi:F-type H+-transporting ATPase subunit epsilon